MSYRALRRTGRSSAFAAAVVLAALLGLSAAQGQGTAGVVIPPQYAGLLPPPVTGSYEDPAFGTTITRLTDSSSLAAGGLVPEYSQTSSFNLDDSYLLLYSSVIGQFHLFDGNGTQVRVLTEIPGGLSEPRWSRSTPDLLYYHSGNRIMSLRPTTGRTELVATFSQYRQIHFGTGQGDISDNERISVVGDDRYIFVYDLANRTPFAVLDTNESPVDGRGFDAVTINQDGNGFVVSYDENGPARGQGMEQFDVNGVFVAQLQNASAHFGMGRDVDGAPAVFTTNSPTNPQQPPGCDNGVVKIALDGTARRTCLIRLAWAMEKHISARGNDGWVYVSTFQPSAQPVPAGADPTDESVWHPYTNEIFRLRADGSAVERLAHHRSRADSYWRQPHANISISGNRLVYGSDFHLDGVGPNYADTFLIELTGSRPAFVPLGLSPHGAIVTRLPTYSWTRTAGAQRYLLTVEGPLGVVHASWYAAQAVCNGATCVVGSPPVAALGLGPHMFYVTAANDAGAGVAGAPTAFEVTFRLFRPAAAIGQAVGKGR